jgi:hypothetical protein
MGGLAARVPETIDKEVGMAEKTEETDERDEPEQTPEPATGDLPVDPAEADKVKGGIYYNLERAVEVGPCDRAAVGPCDRAAR